MPVPSTHLLDVLLNLRTLLRGEDVHDLRAHLLTRLNAGAASARMRLTESLNDLLDLRFLLIAERDAVQHAHEAVAAMVMAALRGSCRRGRGSLLRERRERRDERNAQCRGKKKRTKGLHWMVQLLEIRCLHSNASAAGSMLRIT